MQKITTYLFTGAIINFIEKTNFNRTLTINIHTLDFLKDTNNLSVISLCGYIILKKKAHEKNYFFTSTPAIFNIGTGK